MQITFIALIYPIKRGLGTAKLFVGVARNDVMLNTEGGANVTTVKKLLQAFSLVIKLFQTLTKCCPKSHGPSP